MTETSIVVQIVLTLITSGVVSGVLTYFIRRDANRMKVALAKINAEREETRGDSATTTGLLAVLSTAIQMLEPFRKTLENVAATTTQAVVAVNAVVDRADEMRQVVERRDQETVADRKIRDDHHQTILERLDAQQNMIAAITKQITVATDENTLRHEISKAVLLITEMARDVKLLTPLPEPGKHQADKAEAAPLVSVNQEGKENL